MKWVKPLNTMRALKKHSFEIKGYQMTVDFECVYVRWISKKIYPRVIYPGNFYMTLLYLYCEVNKVGTKDEDKLNAKRSNYVEIRIGLLGFTLYLRIEK